MVNTWPRRSPRVRLTYWPARGPLTIRAKWASPLTGAQVSPSGVAIFALSPVPATFPRVTAAVWSSAKLLPLGSAAAGAGAVVGVVVGSTAEELSRERITKKGPLHTSIGSPGPHLRAWRADGRG